MGAHQSSTATHLKNGKPTYTTRSQDDMLNNNYMRTVSVLSEGDGSRVHREGKNGGISRAGRRSRSAERPRHHVTYGQSRSSPTTPVILTRGRHHSPPAIQRINSPERQRGNSPSCNGRRCSKSNQKSSPLQGVGPSYHVIYCSDDQVSAHREKTELRLETVGTLPGAAIVTDPRRSLISPLQMEVMCETESTLHMKIFDANHERFEVRYAEMREGFPEFSRKARHPQYTVEYRRAPFGVTVCRKSTGHVIFDTCAEGKLHYEDEKIEISTAVHSRYIYGLGEHRKKFLIDTHNESHNFVFWARDQPPKKKRNLYGSHPFFLALEEDGNAYGVFLLNSSAMEIDIQPGDPPILKYTMNGGILDFYIFTGPSPIEVIQQYQEVIGKPHLPPYWALGFHLSRWGYESVGELEKFIESNRRTAIPYESQWSDIDMMKQREPWTYHDVQLISTVHNLHVNGQRYVNIINPGVPLNPSSPVYNHGLEAGIFIRNHKGSRPLVGKVWPGEVVYPDFSHPHVYEFWLNCAQSLYNDIPFDGLWLDMNEPANFVSGCVEDCNLTNSHSKDNPTFVPKQLTGKKLFDQTICASAKQYQGLHYDLHNLYGHMQLIVTDKVCRTLRGRRTLIISRSTFPGSGHYGGHWTGDNSSTFSNLSSSISDMLDFNLFGIPLVGADIGGFFSSCSEELMIRWMQVGSFYPFMRNHNSHPTDAGPSAPQDPGSFSERAQAIIGDIVAVRYSLLPYLYTLLFDNHTKGIPVVRPLFMLYPKDKRTYGIDEQFMWGSALLMSPCIKEGGTSVTAYFPYDIWYNFFTGDRLTKVGADIQLSTPLDSTNMHVRGGSIMITQTPARNTSYSRNNPFGLLAALDSNHIARGKLYWDDGDVLDPVQTQQYNLIKFSVEKNCLTTTIEMLGHTNCTMKLKLVQIFGLFFPPERVLVNGHPASFSYADDQRVLQLDKLDVSLMKPLTISW